MAKDKEQDEKAAAKTGGKKVVKFAFNKSTKNKHQYMELGTNGKPVDKVNDGHIGALYVHRDLLGDEPPSKITVTIEF